MPQRRYRQGHPSPSPDMAAFRSRSSGRGNGLEGSLSWCQWVGSRRKHKQLWMMMDDWMLSARMPGMALAVTPHAKHLFSTTTAKMVIRSVKLSGDKSSSPPQEGNGMLGVKSCALSPVVHNLLSCSAPQFVSRYHNVISTRFPWSGKPLRKGLSR